MYNLRGKAKNLSNKYKIILKKIRNLQKKAAKLKSKKKKKIPDFNFKIVILLQQRIPKNTGPNNIY